VSAGHSYFNAFYENTERTDDWTAAVMGWTGLSWTVRQRDGSTSRFRPCGVGSVCSLMDSRDADGHSIHYLRDRAGRLVKMAASAARWIAFDYDDHDRIVRAYSSNKDNVRYEYDARGRLTRVSSDDGTTRRYSYTDQDQMATVEDPEIGITNTYDANGRCTGQVDRFPRDEETFSYNFEYTVQGASVLATTTKQSDGTWSRYSYNERRQTTSETWGGVEGVAPTTIMYERDPGTGLETALTVTCPDRRGQPLQHRSIVRPETQEWVKHDLLQTHCSWSPRR